MVRNILGFVLCYGFVVNALRVNNNKKKIVFGFAIVKIGK